MTAAERQSHWQNVYLGKGEAGGQLDAGGPAAVARPDREICRDRTASIIDIGGGASRLVDALVARGFAAVTVLDLSEAGLESAKARLGGQRGVRAMDRGRRHGVAAAGRLRHLARPRRVSFPGRGKGPRSLSRSPACRREGGRARHHRDLCARRSGKMQRPAGATLRPGKPEQRPLARRSNWSNISPIATSRPGARRNRSSSACCGGADCQRRK